MTIGAWPGIGQAALELRGILGDFDERISDIDLLAVLSAEISPEMAARPERMHD